MSAWSICNCGEYKPDNETPYFCKNCGGALVKHKEEI